MRKLLILFLFSPVLAFSQLNQTDGKGMKQGKWEKRQANGRLIYEGEFQNNKPVGQWTRYHQGGQVKAEISYRGDTAQTILFDVWRKKVAEGNYVNQKKEGLWSIYKNQQKIAEEEYRNGVKHGVSRKFYNSLEVMEESVWVNGKQEGKYQVFYKNGKPYFQCKMKNDQRNGLVIIYFDNGVQEMVGAYKDNLRHGEWKYQNRDGQHLYSLFYDEGHILNPEVRDSIDALQMQKLEQNKGSILDPEKFMQDPGAYIMKNRMQH